MRKIYKLSLILFIALTSATTLLGQNRFFTDLGENRTVPTAGQREIVPSKYRTYSAPIQNLRNFLRTLPAEQSILSNYKQAPVMDIPMPDGSMARFHVWESSIQEPGLQAKFPENRTYAGQGIDDPHASIRFDYSPEFGFHAQILSFAKGRVIIDPYARGDVNNYISYFTRDYSRVVDFHCGVTETYNNSVNRIAAGPCRGTELYSYRIAVANTNEYATAVGGTTPAALHAQIVTAINRVTGVYETEVAVRLVLIANNDLIEFTTAEPDPFTGNNNAGVLINESQTQITLLIGTANFDIGHTFSTGAGGLAGLGVVCNAGQKARGVTGLTVPLGDVFYIDYVAHEVGHQFRGNHSFNGAAGNCSGGNRNGPTAYEPGSGTTIQAYAGICGTDNIQPNSDPFFHTISFDEISDFVSTGGGSTCEVATPTGNQIPIIQTMSNNGVSIPVSTPFTLTGTAMDPDGDPLTYCWEQWDLGPQGAWNSGATNTTAPNFKSRVPKLTGSRTFPDMAVILAGFPANPAATLNGLKGETLPTVARTMKFRLTVRDNRALGGGVTTGGDGCGTFTSQFQITTVVGAVFAVTAPNGGESYPAGSTQTITWNNTNTTLAPINTANVRITLSTDGGLTYPIEILASTANDGSESVTIPSVSPTTTARVRIEALNNVYFDISNANFNITAAPNGFSFNSPAPVTAACGFAGPMVSTPLTATYFGSFTGNITLSAIAFPGGTNVTFATNPLTTGTPSTTVSLNNTAALLPGNYTVTVQGVGTGVPTQTRDIIFTINAGAGPAITAQPANASICVGQNTSFSITSATATSFQWQVSTDGGGTWNNVANGGVYSNATTATLNITGATLAMNNYRYRAIAGAQCGTTTSNAAILTVNASAAISNHPSDATLCAGASHVFSVTATGTGLTYQWEFSIDGGATYNNVPAAAPYSGTQTANLAINPIAASQNGYRFRVVVTGSGACPQPVTSNAAILSVVTSVNITTQPTDVTVCSGASASFTVAGSGAGIIYVWQVSTDGGGTWNNVPAAAPYSGQATATLTINPTAVSMSGYRYRAQLSNSTCTTPGTSNAAILTVNSLPAISANPANSTICVGGNTTFSSAASGTGIGYQWQVSTDNGVTYNNVVNGGVYSNATTATLTITGATFAMNTYRYRVVVTGTCPPPATSTAAVLTVVQPVSIGAPGQPANSDICSGTNTSFTVTGTSTEAMSHQWQVSTDAGATWNNVTNGGVYSGATTPTLTLTNVPVTMNSYRYRALVSNVSCTVQTVSNSATLFVRLTPTIALAASSTSLLPGQSSILTATPTGAGAGITQTITWQFNGAATTIAGTTYTATVEQVGDYRVFITSAYAGTSVTCSAQSGVVTISATASSRLFIYPSPNNGTFTVSYYNNGGTSTQRTIAIYDSKGSQVLHKKFPITGLYTLIPIDLRAANTGIYYVVVGDAQGNKLADGKVHVR